MYINESDIVLPLLENKTEYLWTNPLRSAFSFSALRVFKAQAVDTIHIHRCFSPFSDILSLFVYSTFSWVLHWLLVRVVEQM